LKAGPLSFGVMPGCNQSCDRYVLITSCVILPAYRDSFFEDTSFIMSDSSQDWGSRPARPSHGQDSTDQDPGRPAEGTPPEVAPEQNQDVEIEDRGIGGAATLPKPTGPGFWQRLEAQQAREAAATGSQIPPVQPPSSVQPTTAPAPRPQAVQPRAQQPMRDQPGAPQQQQAAAYQAPPLAATRKREQPPAPGRRTGQTPPPQRSGCARFGAALLVLLAAGALLFGIVMVGYASVARDLPAADELQARASSFASTLIYDRTGQVLNEVADPNYGRRTAVQLNQISPYVIDATIATEDPNFYEHPGVDPVGIARAAYYAIRERDLSGPGGSTITQQLVKCARLRRRSWRPKSRGGTTKTRSSGST
jgi:hypothetical protein